MAETFSFGCNPCLSEACDRHIRSAASKGYLLIGHGTRNQQGTDEFLQLGELLRQRLAPAHVEPCFLELQEPSISKAWSQLIASGADAICAMPLLLFAAGHAKRDIPDVLRESCAASRAAGFKVCFQQTPPLECNPTLLELSSLRAQQAIDAANDIALARTALVMVGRGSLDDSATAMMLRFSELRGQHLMPAVVRTGFVAMASPKLPQVLDEVAGLADIDTIIVQPHLLFQGDLNQRICQMVDDAAARHRDRRWIKVQRLGPHELLADALIAASGLHA